MNNTVPGLITVRTTSSRLPGKCLMPFGKTTVLEHIVLRARHYRLDPILCTSTHSSDDVLESLAERVGVPIFRGSLINKLQRWLDCCEHFQFPAFHTVDADDPFFDGEEMRRSYELLAEQGYDMVCPTKSSSAGGASVGYSLRTSAVREVCKALSSEEDTEMMWAYMTKLPGIRVGSLPEKSEKPVTRLTLDYEEDYWLLASVARIVGPLASRDKIDDLFARNPDLHKVNWFRNEEWKQAQTDKTATL